MLHHEAAALELLTIPLVPKLLFFNQSMRYKDKLWILETYVPGTVVTTLTVTQYEKVGRLLANVHKVKQTKKTTINFWREFLQANEVFGSEAALLHHPEAELQSLTISAKRYFQHIATTFEPIYVSLIHGDATPNNMLANGHEIAPIDWEFSTFKDPMADFSTLYYEDMEYNQGKWRVQIKPEEKAALFRGYRSSGGHIEEDKLVVWEILDKLGAALYLYWKMHHSGHEIEKQQRAQYTLDLNNLKTSLNRTLR